MKRLNQWFKTFREGLDLHKLHPSHEQYSKENKRDIGRRKFDTAPEIKIKEAVF